jgi:hypothetical protein
VVVFEEVAVLKHLILVANVVLRFASQALLHHARFECVLSRRSYLVFVCTRGVVLAKCSTWLVY